jgi:predicted SnoaL-like aldol condensation-catalyzing enzyme
MKIVTPFRMAALISTLSLALSATVSLVLITNREARAQTLDAVDSSLIADSDMSSKDCPRSKQVLDRNKQNAVGYYLTAFNDKNPRLAVQLYGGAEYIQHNPLAQNGFDAFIAFVESFTAAFPDAHIDIKRVFAECDFVITHALATGAVPVYGDLGTKLVDIFRMDANGKVVEHWDVAARISATSANGNPEV